MSLTQDDLVFLAAVKDYCQKKPEITNHLVQYAVQGVIDRANKMQEMAGDMETVAVAMYSMLDTQRLGPKLREQMSALALNKMAKYHPGHTFFSWKEGIIKKTDGE